MEHRHFWEGGALINTFKSPWSLACNIQIYLGYLSPIIMEEEVHLLPFIKPGIDDTALS